MNSSLDVIDHSPHHPSPAAPLPNASNLVLIDNYDSFTWNVYQYLVLEGARVTVYRNDEITLEDLIQKRPSQLVISPGPGHPDTDSGISKDAIQHFAGKIPILGVCMGEQCMYSVFGGEVDVTGQIFHGKTSKLKHDSKGVYQDVPQNVPVTRYHSLAGTHRTLPECLEVSSWIHIEAPSDVNRDVIMGVRHKEYTVEGVQFHPESILTAEGRPMLKNFLKVRGGTWAQNDRFLQGLPPQHPKLNGINGDVETESSSTSTQSQKPSILEQIYDHRRKLIARQKRVPSMRPNDLQAAYDLNLSPPQISFPDRLRISPYSLSLMAEIKRASPSKGVIAIDACAPEQAQTYALAGASVISVLTEPEWFKGSMQDLRAVRQSLNGMPNRPAILCKEFIFDEYQILEARLAGADTVLLIVKMLEQDVLEKLYHYSRSLGMEPLVEVNTIREMDIAIKLGSQVIGVNNRNLTNFEVDMETTRRLMGDVPKETIVCALSGIMGPKDVQPFRKCGVGAVLVGEALMRAANATQFVKELLGGMDLPLKKPSPPELLVKICGTRSAEAAKAAIEAGADLIGMILVKGRKRCVDEATAVSISETVRATEKTKKSITRMRGLPNSASDALEHSATNFTNAPHRALLVGVFQNQPLSYILEQQKLLDLDIVQLHGDEPLEWSSLIPVPVIHAFKPADKGVSQRGFHALPLLDAGAGGSGDSVDLSSLKPLLEKDHHLRFMLAGGLNPENVKSKVRQLREYGDHIVAVDVSSGVEEDGVQSLEKIKAFVKAAKAADSDDA